MNINNKVSFMSTLENTWKTLDAKERSLGKGIKLKSTEAASNINSESAMCIN